MSRVITILHKTFEGQKLKNFCTEENFFNPHTLKSYYPQAVGLSYKINSEVSILQEVNDKLILHPLVNCYELVTPESNNDMHLEIGVDKLLQVELVKKYFYKKYRYEEICGMLTKKHGINISIRSLKRILQKLNLRRKNMHEDDLEKIVFAIMQEVQGDGCNLGYRAMWHRLRNVYKIQVKMNTVLDILRLVDPDGVDKRLRHRLKRREYSAPGPNFIFHIDGNDKLKQDGFAIHACIDGYSKRIIWLKVGKSNNNPKIVAGYYLEAVKELGVVPTLLRSDRGTENTMVELLQIALRSFHKDDLAGEKSYLSGKSTANQRIEHYWCILRHQVLDYYRELFRSMKHKLILDISNPLQVELLRFCFGHLIQNSLDTIKNEWNDHRIRKQNNRNIPGAIPNVMYYWPEKYHAKDYGKSIDLTGIQELYRSYVTESTLYDDEITELVMEILPNFVQPSTSEEAQRLFVTLVNATSEYVK